MSTDRTEPDRSMFSVFAAITSIAAFLIATLGVIIVATDDGGGSASVSTGATTVEVKLTEFAVTPKALTAKAGTVTIVVTNAGTMPQRPTAAARHGPRHHHRSE